MHEFLTSNAAKYRLLRTIVQGIIGVIIANLDLLTGYAPIPSGLKPFIAALIMACLSPIMAAMGGDGIGDDELYTRGPGEEYDESIDDVDEWIYIDDDEVVDDE